MTSRDPAATAGVYGLFLAALFILASGITILQVSANPYVSALGDPKTASSRLTMTQAFNSFGTTIAPFFGASLLFAGGHEPVAGDASAVQLPYVMLALSLVILAAVFAYLKLPNIQDTSADGQGNLAAVLKYPHLVLGAVGIFVYVGAEVAIGSFLVNFFSLPEIAGIGEAEASKLIAFYWGGAMVGRFIGAYVMQHIAAGKVLAFNAFMAVVLIVLAVTTTGHFAMWAILLVGLCNSIMFPTIFSLAIEDLGELKPQGSGVLCTAIAGGAFIPLIYGFFTDMSGFKPAFIVVILCYVYILFYGKKQPGLNGAAS